MKTVCMLGFPASSAYTTALLLTDSFGRGKCVTATATETGLSTVFDSLHGLAPRLAELGEDSKNMNDIHVCMYVQLF